ncbi:MAG: hypothetical protein JWM12_1812 [Ilumatobacteraceae bacterium]|nr:hypothetical protein [Ilumatobacteraceae bacterium]
MSCATAPRTSSTTALDPRTDAAGWVLHAAARLVASRSRGCVPGGRSIVNVLNVGANAAPASVLSAARHDDLRIPSCQISFNIDGLALGVATAIVERT